MALVSERYQTMTQIFRLPALLRVTTLLVLTAACCSSNAADLKLLFMGDNGHHRPEARFQELAPALEARGIQLKYTDRMEDLSPDTLAQFDGLVLYANIDRIEDSQAKAVLNYVAFGKCCCCKIIQGSALALPVADLLQNG